MAEENVLIAACTSIYKKCLQTSRAKRI